MEADLTGFKVAIFVLDGVQAESIQGFQNALNEVGASVHLIAPEGVKSDAVSAEKAPVEHHLGRADEAVFDALILPDSSGSPETLAGEEGKGLISDFLESGKPVVAIGRSAELLAQNMDLSGRRLGQAGESKLVVDRGLITGATPSADVFHAVIREFLEIKSRTGASLHTD
jgi:protease I